MKPFVTRTRPSPVQGQKICRGTAGAPPHCGSQYRAGGSAAADYEAKHRNRRKKKKQCTAGTVCFTTGLPTESSREIRIPPPGSNLPSAKTLVRKMLIKSLAFFIREGNCQTPSFCSTIGMFFLNQFAFCSSSEESPCKRLGTLYLLKSPVWSVESGVQSDLQQLSQQAAARGVPLVPH